MTTKRTLIVLHHDEGYSDVLLHHLNAALRGKDMMAEAVIGDAAHLSRLETAVKQMLFWKVDPEEPLDQDKMLQSYVYCRRKDINALRDTLTAGDGEGEK